ncbi:MULTISPECIES: adventurous gliding motility protein GltJ [unclassified Corallococcus]|uniref:adventurous gliding motility protein GltJ n=1 Tax=unclassified Corallococcus TaxID=2685029 RepID=UPI001A8D1A6C|nr:MULTISPECIES: adventurous gliding motility protein GltJ [unclassified Corallococcus]MBN9686696.1 adventurous gliding motility protein GltJ [Corallococcus sp. NCSPR001]WAS81885.1 adventurous gliding motility protein GltJ [Corallococcus sp. NCRR]
MRFVCDSCRAQYMISDDKVGPKGVKLRCKKCGHTILVRPAGASAAKEGGAEASASTETKSSADANAPRIVESSGTGLPATLGTPPEGGLFTDVEEDEIGAVFDQVLSTGSQKLKAAEAEAEAKAAKAEAVRKLAEAESAEPTAEEKAATASHEWYVAIDEKQVGPWTVEKVKDAWDRGEVGPDNLCWRSGFSDWIPLSETAELASVLAPRPAKPVIVAPAPVSTSSPTIPAGPVESAFSAGASRPGAGGNSAVAEEPVGWKPSAASVLASLVKEENDALSKPPPRPAPSLEREPLSQSRLLDVPVPPPEPVSSPAMPGAMMAAAPGMAAPQPYAPPQPQGYAPQPPVQQQYAPQPQGYAPQQPQMPYGQQPQGYPPPGYPAAYPPPAAAPTGGKGRTGMMVAVTAGVLVMAGAAVVFVARGNSSERPAEQPTQVAAAPTPKAEMPPMPPPPAAVQTPPPAAVQPAAAPTAPAGTPAEGTAATAAAGTPAAAGATPPAATPTVATAPAATPTPPPAAEVKPASATQPNMGTAVARVDPRNHRKSGSSGSRGSSRDDDEGDAITVSKPSSSSSSSSSNSGGGDDDFDELFGTKKPAAAKPASKPTATAYIPPEPGGGTLDRLQQSDIMQVVLNNKPAIVKCVNEQKQKDPSLSGKLVMRWTVQTSGKTSNVSCRTDEFRSSYMATCITGLIKSWSFPKHQKQGEPIDFPFTF